MAPDLAGSARTQTPKRGGNAGVSPDLATRGAGTPNPQGSRSGVCNDRAGPDARNEQKGELASSFEPSFVARPRPFALRRGVAFSSGRILAAGGVVALIDCRRGPGNGPTAATPVSGTAGILPDDPIRHGALPACPTVVASAATCGAF